MFPEVTAREIDGWDILKAVKMSKNVKERHGATPYCFMFRELEVNGKEIIRSSGFFFLGGTIKTLDDIPDTPQNYTLRTNMRNNEITHVLENDNSWKATVPFRVGHDMLLGVGI